MSGFTVFIRRDKRGGWAGFLGSRKAVHFAQQEAAEEWLRKIRAVRAENMIRVQEERRAE